MKDATSLPSFAAAIKNSPSGQKSSSGLAGTSVDLQVEIQTIRDREIEKNSEDSQRRQHEQRTREMDIIRNGVQ